ncbi:hypothetical protein DH2020_004007 [Rehmannia glutinosa]|uniref:Inhibitor I9 domain-containing protein n=1 Tax=Rehmannia glutinosa TaxID=99300 RepID=A0ABR0XN73_REHGL
MLCRHGREMKETVTCSIKIFQGKKSLPSKFLQVKNLCGSSTRNCTAKMKLKLLPVVTILFLCHAFTDAEEKNNQHKKKTFIIHMDKSNMPPSFDDHLDWYESSLKSVSTSTNMLYTYNNVIHGYSAQLTLNEAILLKQQQGILLVQEDTIYKLHTTRSPEFLGLLNTDASLPDSNTPSDVIIGVLDTGVWPEIGSFDDKELGPVPNGWKAAGSTVVGASLFGYGVGTARGMARRARLAAYKVCWLGGCVSSDILAAMEKAIEDGVNILSLSLGGSISDYFRDTVAIGAFATPKGFLFRAQPEMAGLVQEACRMLRHG